MVVEYRYKDQFTVIGKAGQGLADNATNWINALWDKAGDNFSEIEKNVRKDDKGGAFWWGLMDGNGVTIKYMTGCEADLNVAAPEGWEKWNIPAQIYLVTERSSGSSGEVYTKIKNDPALRIKGAGYVHYPVPENYDVFEIYCPITTDTLVCQSCSMPMTKPEDFGIEANGNPNRDYCSHCYVNGALRNDVTMDKLIADVQKLIGIENEHTGLLSRPLLSYIKEWCALEGKAKVATILILHTKLVDGQDCDFTGTQWEKEWLADGKVCQCIACVAARKCISDIKLMEL